MRSLTVIGNWKMNGSFATNGTLFSEFAQEKWFSGQRHSRFGLCVPYPYLSQAQSALAGSGIGVGAQDVSDHAYGAYTGDVSATMLHDFACQYVIVGHSERRQYHHESDELIARKAKAALLAQVTPIVCVGETEAQRDAGQTTLVVRKQLQAVLDLLQGQIAQCIVAYEPVWAIGTGQVASAQQAQDVHRELRLQLAKFDDEAASVMPILYGGSLKPDNAKELLAMPDIDGGLVGGASLSCADFLAICQAV